MSQVSFFNSIAKDWDNISKVDESKINYLLLMILPYNIIKWILVHI